VRGAQVGCVNAMMRYVVESAEGPRAIDIARTGSTTDLETGGASEGEEEVTATQPPPGTAAQAHEDPIDAFIRKQRDATTAPAAPSGTSPTPAPAPPAPPAPPPLRIPPRGVW
jgi:hypothetical protein